MSSPPLDIRYEAQHGWISVHVLYTPSPTAPTSTSLYTQDTGTLFPCLQTTIFSELHVSSLSRSHRPYPPYYTLTLLMLPYFLGLHAGRGDVSSVLPSRPPGGTLRRYWSRHYRLPWWSSNAWRGRGRTGRLDVLQLQPIQLSLCAPS